MEFAEALIFLKYEWSTKFKLNNKKNRANYQNVSQERKTMNTKNLIYQLFSRKKKLCIEKRGGNEDSLFGAYEQNENHQFSYADI